MVAREIDGLSGGLDEVQMLFPRTNDILDSGGQGVWEMRRHFHAARMGWGTFLSRGHGCPCCGCPGFVVTKEQALKELELHKERLQAELAEVDEEIKEIRESD